MADDTGFVHLPPKRQDGEAGFTALPPRAKQIGESDEEIATGALADTLGLSKRPGAVRATSNKPGEKTPLGVVVNPANTGESMIEPAIMSPAYAAMPGGALGRIALATGVGGAKEAARGGGLSQIGLHSVIDGAVAALTEGTAAGIAHKGSKMAAKLLANEESHEGMRRAFQYATDAPQKAYDAIASRLKGAKVVIPSLGSAKVTLDEAVKKLAALEGDAYRVARAEIADWIRRLDKQLVPKPNAGQVFKATTSPTRFQPPAPPTGTVTERAGKAATAVANNPGARAVADAAMTGPLPGDDGMPRGALVAAGVASEGEGAFHRLLRYVMPGH